MAGSQRRGLSESGISFGSVVDSASTRRVNAFRARTSRSFFTSIGPVIPSGWSTA